MRKLALVLALIAPATYAVTGKVVNEEGQPIADAVIEIAGSKGLIRTNAAGEFDLGASPVDEIHVEAPNYSHKVLHLHNQTEGELNIVLAASVIEQVDVIGLPIHASSIESVQPVSVVTGEELRNQQASTLGESLKSEIGVHSSYFGPVASSPIIRGMDGPRVMVTQNGLDLGDVSRVGPDHVVSSDASTAQQIEILRGPSTLFFGSGAIGGVVNVVDDRVPSSTESLGSFSVGHNTVANEDEISAAYTGGVQNIAFHLDGFWRDADDYNIPGIAVKETEEEHEEEGHEEHVEGVLENSASESHGYNLGGSYLFDAGYVGISYGRLEKLNGVPGHSHEHGHEEEETDKEEPETQVLSDLKQDRWQLISEIQVDNSFIESINARVGYTDYQHTEIEREDGIDNTGTIFNNETTQLRLDMTHKEFAGWHGALSVESKLSDFEAVGEEAFTSPSKTRTTALALVEEHHNGPWLWQLGARVEQVTLSADDIQRHAHEHEGEEEGEEEEFYHVPDLEFLPLSLSAGFVVDFADGYKFGTAYTHSQRAPSASELFSYGPHIATGIYEVGALFDIHQEGDETHLEFEVTEEMETSNNIDVSLRKHTGNLGFEFNVFMNKVKNYYYQENTGFTSDDLFGEEAAEVVDGEVAEDGHEHAADLPVYIFKKDDATFVGAEFELVWQVMPDFRWVLWGDAIKGELDNGENLPRIPPKRIATEWHYDVNNWSTELDITHYFEQNDIASNETPTDAYDMVDLRVSYRIDSVMDGLTLFAKVQNLTDEEGRVHSSYLKDKAPLPGRGISLGIRGSF